MRGKLVLVLASVLLVGCGRAGSLAMPAGAPVGVKRLASQVAPSGMISAEAANPAATLETSIKNLVVAHLPQDRVSFPQPDASFRSSYDPTRKLYSFSGQFTVTPPGGKASTLSYSGVFNPAGITDAQRLASFGTR